MDFSSLIFFTPMVIVLTWTVYTLMQISDEFDHNYDYLDEDGVTQKQNEFYASLSSTQNEKSFDQHASNLVPGARVAVFVEKTRTIVIVYRFKKGQTLHFATSVHENEDQVILTRRQVKNLKHMLIETACDRLVNNPRIASIMDGDLQKAAVTFLDPLFTGDFKNPILNKDKVRISKKKFHAVLRKIVCHPLNRIILSGVAEDADVHVRPEIASKISRRSKTKTYAERGYRVIGTSKLVNDISWRRV
jgi:hypothetical protein